MPRFPRRPRLDRGHALAPGLVAAFMPLENGSVADLLRPDRGSGAAAGTVDAGTYGPAARDWTSPAGTAADLQFTAGGFTVAALVDLTALPGSGGFPVLWSNNTYVSETANQGWTLQLRPSSDAHPGWCFQCYRNNSTNAGYGTGLSAANPATSSGTGLGDHLVVGTSDGSALRSLYVDGTPASTSSYNPSPVASAAGVYNESQGGGQAPAYLCLAWTRVLSAAEVLGLWLDPARLFSARLARAGYSAAYAPPGLVHVPPIGGGAIVSDFGAGVAIL